ncbi:hypothetical protein E2R68_00805 [Psychromonas sp. RZ22]|uniref:serine hydrolase n=1 Tax=Psychromonas algarum TaxID=2555643 RepID=UPI0010684782|nr:serine hydrolase [Psychromonas sp. RZ22]TEW56609.1 hypothetical protein E2R68_00805 [Psychromonas sp. RZ22]
MLKVIKESILLFCLLFSIQLFADTDSDLLQQKVEHLENSLKAQIGVSLLQPEANRSWSYKGDQRFPLTSTFKTYACAALLMKRDKKEVRLDKKY